MGGEGSESSCSPWAQKWQPAHGTLLEGIEGGNYALGISVQRGKHRVLPKRSWGYAPQVAFSFFWKHFNVVEVKLRRDLNGKISLEV